MNILIYFRLLSYLEDVTGSSRFKEPIEILKTRVTDLNELRTQKWEQVKLAEKEKDALKKPNDEARDYLLELNKIVKKKDILCQLKVHLVFNLLSVFTL